MQDFNSFSLMFYYIISTTYQKIGDLFCPVHISGLSHSVSSFNTDFQKKIEEFEYFGGSDVANKLVISNIVTSCIVLLHTGIGANFASPMWILSRNC